MGPQCQKNFWCCKPDGHGYDCEEEPRLCRADSYCGLPRTHPGECSPRDETGEYRPRALANYERLNGEF